MVRPAILSLISSWILAGCCGPPVYITPELPLPDWPTLPAVGQDEFVLLEFDGDEPAYRITGDVYKRLAVRETLRRRYAEELRQIIIRNNRMAEGAE